MFWRFNFPSSNIDTLLENEDVTLETIISEEDVLQECKGRNTKLIDFLTKAENMRGMLDLMIQEPQEGVDEKMKYRLPNISSELLMSDVNEITDSLLNQHSTSALQPHTSSTNPLISLSEEATTPPIEPTTPPHTSPSLVSSTDLTESPTTEISSTQPPTTPPTTPTTPPTTPPQQPTTPPTTPPQQPTTPPTTSPQPPSHLDRLFSFLDQPTLNPLQASFVSKVIGLLIMRKSSQMLTYLKSRSNSLQQLLRHVSTSAVMDVVLKLVVNMDSQATRTECLMWLKDEGLIIKLVDLFKHDLSSDAHYNASQLLCDIVKYSREQIAFEQEPICNNYNNNNDNNYEDNNVANNISSNYHILLNVIQSESTVSTLLDHMFQEPLQESLVLSGLQVLHTLLELKKIGDTADEACASLSLPSGLLLPSNLTRTSLPDIDKFMTDAQGTLKSLVPRLACFHQLLVTPPRQHYTPMCTTYGSLDLPFGPSRYQTTKLLVNLLSLNHSPSNQKLLQLGTLGVLLDLFHKYCWNNFLHTQFCHLVEALLTNATPSLNPSTTTLDPQASMIFNTNHPLSSNKNQDEGDGEVKMEFSTDPPSTDQPLNTPTIADPPTTSTSDTPPPLPTRQQSTPLFIDTSTKLLSQLIIESRLLERVMDSFEKTTEIKSRSGSCGHGYTGHMMRMANQLSSHKHQALINYITTKGEFPSVVSERWMEFVDVSLVDINNLNAPDNVLSPQVEPHPSDETLKLSFHLDPSTQKTYGYIEESMAEQDDFGWSNLSPTSQELSQGKNSMFEDMCDERKDGEDEDDDGADDEEGLEGNGEKGGDDDDDDVWEDKLVANYPESLLKPDLLEKLKEVENEQKLETIRINDSDVVMATEKREAKSELNKNVEDMDTTNGVWATFDDPAGIAMQTNNNEASDWADFSQLEKEDRSDEGRNSDRQDVVKTTSVENSPVTPPLASQ